MFKRLTACLLVLLLCSAALAETHISGQGDPQETGTPAAFTAGPEEYARKMDGLFSTAVLTMENTATVNVPAFQEVIDNFGSWTSDEGNESLLYTLLLFEIKELYPQWMEHYISRNAESSMMDFDQVFIAEQQAEPGVLYFLTCKSEAGTVEVYRYDAAAVTLSAWLFTVEDGLAASDLFHTCFGGLTRQIDAAPIEHWIDYFAEQEE